MEVSLDDWFKCTANVVVTEEDRSIQNIMRMEFPLSDPRGTLVRPGKIKREQTGMVWYETILVPVYDINEPTI